MLRWIVRSCQRQFRVRRSILFPVILFTITTSLLYALVEYYTLPIHPSLISSTIEQWRCQVKNETIRAIDLAPSETCKRLLKNISCRIDSQTNFFPRTLPRFCPIQKGHFGEVIGCSSSDVNATHRINNFQTVDSATMCIDYCLKLSVSFAEYNNFTGHCYCLSSSDHSPCSEFEKNAAIIYRTGYLDFGNHLDKRRPNTDNSSTTIVFFLTVGGRKNLRQIKRLIRAIYARQHYYLIHVDSVCLFLIEYEILTFSGLEQREDYLYRELNIFSKTISNIHLTNKRFPTTWGSSTLLTAHLEAFKQIFEELKWKFSFILNLSESDFPLKPVQVLTNFLSTYTSYNFLRSHNREPFKFIQSQGMFHTFIQCDNYMYRIGPRPLIQNIVYDGGSDWYVLNRDFVHYVTYGNDELVHGLRHTFNYSLLPCEAIFHTVLSNSIYCDSYIRNNLRLVHWNRERGCKCQHKNVVDWCGCSPIVYRSMDRVTLNETVDKPLFFARKFDPTIDELILDWLDEKISRRDLSNGAFYLQNIYHFKDDSIELDHVGKLMHSYAQTTMHEYRQYRRHCLRDDTVQLIQIHFVYQASIFQGYSLQYLFPDGEQVEVLIKLNTLGAIRSNELKRFEVGIDLDSKELVFIDRSRTFIEPKLVKVLIQWESMTENDTSLVINSPNGAIVQRVKLLPSNEPVILDISFPTVSWPTMIGIWQMSIVKENTENLLASLNFLILSSSDEPSLSIKYLTIMTNFWSIVNTCSTMIGASHCRDFSNQTIPTTMNNCFQQRWSYFFHDIKSDW